MLNNVISLSDITIYLKLGKWYRQKKNYNKSLIYLKKAIQLEPNNMEAQLLLSKLYQNLNDINLAIKHFEIVLTLNPLDWELKHTAINLYLQEKQYSKASKILAKRIHWFKGDLNWWTRFKGSILSNKKTKTDFERVLFQLAFALREEEQNLRALKFAKMLSRRKKDSISHYLLATIYEAIPDYIMAEKEFSKIARHFMPLNHQFYESIYQKLKENLLIPQVGAS